MPRCRRTNIPQHVPNAQNVTSQAAEEARRWNDGWKHCEKEYVDSNGTDFGYPNPFTPGTPEHQGYLEASTALQHKDEEMTIDEFREYLEENNDV